MEFIFNALPYVTSGLTLVAFLGAIIAFSYRSRLDARAKQIELMPEADRLAAISAEAEFFNVRVDDLPRAERASIVITQIKERSRRQTQYFIIALVAAVLLAILAAIAIWRPGGFGQDTVVSDIGTLSTGSRPEVVAALDRLAGTGPQAAQKGVCGAIETYVETHAKPGQLEATATLQNDIQAAASALSALHASGGCKIVDLSAVDLTRLVLPNAHFAGVQLTGSHLNEANLTNADLQGAELTGVDLTDAVLRGAKLKGARFASADLTRTKFGGATDACLRGARNAGDAAEASQEWLTC